MNARAKDTGLATLALMLRYHGLAAEPDHIWHLYNKDGRFGSGEILRCAYALKLKARRIRAIPERLNRLPLPAIAEARDGSFFIIAKIGGQAQGEWRALVQEPLVSQPRLITSEELGGIWSGHLILLASRAHRDGPVQRFDIAWFVQAMQKYRGLLGEVLVASLFLQLFALVTPLVFQVIIDKVLVYQSLETLNVLVFALIAAALFESVLAGLRTYLFSHTTNRIDVELGARLFRHLVSLPMGYFQARRTGDSVARIRELENVRNFLTGSALTLAIDLGFTLIFLAIMLCYSAGLTLVVAASFPAYAVISVAFTRTIRQRLDEKFARGAENQAFLVESITGIETLRAMAVEPRIQREWEEQLAGYVGASFRVTNLANWGSQGIQLVSKLITALILLLGAEAVIGDDMTIGELVAFNMLAARVGAPVLRLAQLWQDFQQTRVSIDRLGDILNTPPEPGISKGHVPLPAIRGEVIFDRVDFRYRLDGPQILNGINLAASAGQVIGIVGPSGSGKSTFAKLVQRLYVPESGRVLIDGVDLAMVDPAWLRRQIGVVLQESVLFNRSVRDNIALSDGAMPIEQVTAAAKLSGAHDFILELPRGYDTIVGERGTTLSGGQRQRIAIARALAADPKILVFDEATSALDYESERLIHDNMRRICAGRTVFIVAHRLSAVRHADRIITIERGRLVEDGSHEQLIGTGGHYSAMWRSQAGLQGVIHG